MLSRKVNNLLVPKAHRKDIRPRKNLLVSKASYAQERKSASKELSPPTGPLASQLPTAPHIPRLPVPKSKSFFKVKGEHAKLAAMPPPPKLQAIPVAVTPPPEHGHCLLLLLEHGSLYARYVCVRHCAQTGMAIGGWGQRIRL